MYVYTYIHILYVVDRARVNSPTRYSPEALAEGLYQVGLFTSALSYLYHGYFLNSPLLPSTIIGYFTTVSLIPPPPPPLYFIIKMYNISPRMKVLTFPVI